MVFIFIYLISSILAKDFYKVPIASAFVLASIYAIIITPGSISERNGIFSKGAGDHNVLLMIWIFVMAGAFASVAKSIGTVEATVNLTLFCWQAFSLRHVSFPSQSARALAQS